MRVKTTECTSSSAACRLKNRLRLLAQWLICEASAAVSVDTKSDWPVIKVAGVVNVVMVCSGCVKDGFFTAICQLQKSHASALDSSYAKTLGFHIRRCCTWCRTGAWDSQKVTSVTKVFAIISGAAYALFVWATGTFKPKNGTLIHSKSHWHLESGYGQPTRLTLRLKTSSPPHNAATSSSWLRRV